MDVIKLLPALLNILQSCDHQIPAKKKKKKVTHSRVIFKGIKQLYINLSIDADRN